MVMMVEHTLQIAGPRVAEGRPAPAPVGNILRQIESTAKEAVRMGFRHSSRKPGRVPAWLEAAEDIRFVGVSPGSESATLLHFQAPKFGDVADEPFRERGLFDILPAGTDTAFDLLGDILGDIAARVTDSERYDTGLLQRFEKFHGTVFNHGVEAITIQGDRLSTDSPPRIDEQLVQTAASLFRETPAPKRARVAGKLDMIRDSDRVFNLILQTGERLRGVWAGGDTSVLADYFKQSVVVGGTAVFRPSGALLRVDADAMALAGAKDSFFSVMPTPTPRKLDVPEMVRARKSRGGIAAVIGKWPGDETEEELLAALKEMR